MEVGIIDEEYQEMRNNFLYWEDSYRKIEGAIAERDAIIGNLQGLYTEWRDKYPNMAILTNYALQDFPDRMKESDQVMCPDNIPHQVYNFVKFCKKTMDELITDVEALRNAQGVTFQVNL